MGIFSIARDDGMRDFVLVGQLDSCLRRSLLDAMLGAYLRAVMAIQAGAVHDKGSTGKTRSALTGCICTTEGRYEGGGPPPDPLSLLR